MAASVGGFSALQLIAGLNDESHLPQLVPHLVKVLEESGITLDKQLYAQTHTRISTLLQSKQARIRWAAACLADALINASGGQGERTLSSHGGTWIKLLLRNLDVARQAVLFTATLRAIHSIISHAQGKAEVLRDAVTPALPSLFATLTKTLDGGQPAVVREVLQRLVPLIRCHPTSFRSFAGKLHNYCLAQLNGSCRDVQIRRLVARAFVTLHLCAPKNTSATEWASGVAATVDELHNALSYLETPLADAYPVALAGLGMLPFSTDQYETEVSSAVSRIDALLTVLSGFLTSRTTTPVKLPISVLARLTDRMLAIDMRRGIKASTPRSTQAALITLLPGIRRRGYRLARLLVQTLALSTLPFVDNWCRIASLERTPAALDLLVEVFRTVGPLSDLELRPVVQAAVDTIERSLVSSTVRNLSVKRKADGQTKDSSVESTKSSDVRVTRAEITTSIDILREICSLPQVEGVPSRLQDRACLALAKLAAAVNGGVAPNARAIDALAHIEALGPLRPISAALASLLGNVAAHIHARPPTFAHTLATQSTIEVARHPRVPALRRRPLQWELDAQDEDEVVAEAEPEDEKLDKVGSDNVAQIDMVEDVQSTPPAEHPSAPLDTRSSVYDVSPQVEPVLTLPAATPPIIKEPSPTPAPSHALPHTPQKQQIPDAVHRDPPRQPSSLTVGKDYAHADAAGGGDDDDNEEIPEICMDSDTDPEDMSDSEED